MPPKKRPIVQCLDDEDTSNQFHYHQQAWKPQRGRQVTDDKPDQYHQQQKDADRGPEAVGGGERRQEKHIDKDGADDGAHGEEDSKGYTSSESRDRTSFFGSRFLEVKLQATRISMQCPICLGIIRKTRTILACLHRFCKECIDKSMRLRSKECPTCRRHCASRRAMRDDPVYDEIIACVYPDIDKYEEEELTLLEEEKARNKQVQNSIAKIAQLQYKASRSRRGLLGKDTASAVSPTSANHGVGYSSRGNQVINIQGSEDDGENHNKAENDSTSQEETSTEITQIRRKRQARTRPSLPSSMAANAEEANTETEARIQPSQPSWIAVNSIERTAGTDEDTSKVDRGVFPGLVSNPEMPSWGPRGARSHTRHGSSKSSRSNRLSKFVDYLQSLNENKDEADVHLMLVPVDKENTPRLVRPYLCCRPSLSINHLSQYVAQQTNLQAEVEMFSLKGCNLEQSTGYDSILRQKLDLVALGY